MMMNHIISIRKKKRKGALLGGPVEKTVYLPTIYRGFDQEVGLRKFPLASIQTQKQNARFEDAEK